MVIVMTKGEKNEIYENLFIFDAIPSNFLHGKNVRIIFIDTLVSGQRVG